MVGSMLAVAVASVELGLLSTNPARSVELPKIRPVEKIFLNCEEVEKLVESALLARRRWR